MCKFYKPIGIKLFPEIRNLAIAIHNVKSFHEPKIINWVKEFSHAGYVRKIHSISKKENEEGTYSYHIAESTFYTNKERTAVKCKDRDFFLLSDYYTGKYMTFYNKLILVQCDFKTKKKYKIISIEEGSFNKTPITHLEEAIANTLSMSDEIKVI